MHHEIIFIMLWNISQTTLEIHNTYYQMHDKMAIQATRKPQNDTFCNCNSYNSWNYAFQKGKFKKRWIRKIYAEGQNEL